LSRDLAGSQEVMATPVKFASQCADVISPFRWLICQCY